MVERWRGLFLVFDLYCFDRLVAFGWRMSLRTFQILAGWLLVVAVPIILATSLLLSRALAETLTSVDLNATGEGSAAPDEVGVGVLLLLVLTNLYVGGLQVTRQAMSRRRYGISHSPNLSFYRSLDIRMIDVFLIYAALRTVVLAGAIGLANVGFVIVFGTVGPPLVLWWSIAILMPASVAAASIALAARYAVHGGQDRYDRAGPTVVVALLAGVAGYSLTWLATDLTAGSSAPTWLRDLDVTGLAAAAVLGSLTLGIGAAIAVGRGVRRMVGESFVIRPVSGGPAPQSRPARAVRQLLWRVSPVGAVLHLELAGHHSAVLMRRVLGATAIGLCFVVGAAQALDPQLIPNGLADVISRAAVFVTFVVCLVLTELAMFAIGPATLSRQLRYAWEAGLKTRTITVSAVGYYLVPVVLFGLLLSLGFYLAIGRWPVAAIPIGVSIVCAAVIGQALTATPKETVDGSVEANLFVALVTVLLSAPVLILALLANPVGTSILIGYLTLLLGGAIACLARRLEALPLTSAT